MATRVLIPVDSTAAASNAYESVRAAVPEDAYLVFVRVLTPDDETGRSRARSGLVRCLMVYRSRGVQSETQLIEAETIPAGIADAASRFNIDEILCIQGHGADDPSGIIAELRSLTSLPVKTTAIEGEVATAG